MNATTARWTHQAELAADYKVGPEQFYRFESSNARTGSTVTLYKDPALQDGDLITIRGGNGDTGVARISDLRNVRPIA